MRPALAAFLTLSLLALPALAGGIADLPELTDQQVEQFRSANSKGTKALQKGKHSRAAFLYQKAARIHGGNEGLWYNLACAQALQQRTALTLEALDRALEAGWRDASWPAKDTDLASVQDTLGFEEWLGRVEAAAGDEGWPQPERDTIASDEEFLEETADAWQEAIQRLRGVLGAREASRARRELAAWKAASWDRIAARSTDGEARAEASWNALREIAGTDATRLSEAAAAEVLRRSENFAVAFASAEHASIVRLRGAEARFAQARRSEDEETKSRAQESFERELLRLADTAEPGPGLDGALIRLIGYRSDDLDAASRLHARLIASAEDPEEARKRMRSGYTTRGIAYKIEGLPDFAAVTTDGSKLTRTGLPGRLTLIDFWATWCGPCKAELPHVKEAYAKYHDSGFDIVGISLDKEADKDQAAFLAWCEESELPWPQVYDGKGWEAELAEHFGVKSIPFMLLVDDHGRVLAADDELRGEGKLLEVVGERLGLASDEAVGGL